MDKKISTIIIPNPREVESTFEKKDTDTMRKKFMPCILNIMNFKYIFCRLDNRFYLSESKTFSKKKMNSEFRTD